ncbi:MAG TPA: hypothetical protein VI391_03915, partial [Thermoanaerobaculia bacterium]
RLFRAPLRQALLDFLMGQNATSLRISKALLDFLPDIDVVLDVFERSILRQIFEHLAYLILCLSHS